MGTGQSSHLPNPLVVYSAHAHTKKMVFDGLSINIDKNSINRVEHTKFLGVNYHPSKPLMAGSYKSHFFQNCQIHWDYHQITTVFPF